MGDSHRPRNITELLQATKTPLAKLQHRAQQLCAIREYLVRAVDASLAAHLHVAGYQRGQLLLHADSGAWLQRARFARAQILQSLRQAGMTDLRGLDIVVRPTSAPIQTTASPPLFQRTLSTSSRQLLFNLGQELGGDLGSALIHLSHAPVGKGDGS